MTAVSGDRQTAPEDEQCQPGEPAPEGVAGFEPRVGEQEQAGTRRGQAQQDLRLGPAPIQSAVAEPVVDLCTELVAAHGGCSEGLGGKKSRTRWQKPARMPSPGTSASRSRNCH